MFYARAGLVVVAVIMTFQKSIKFVSDLFYKVVDECQSLIIAA